MDTTTRPPGVQRPARRQRRRSVARLQPRSRLPRWGGRLGSRRMRTLRRLLAVLLVVAAGWIATRETTGPGVEVVVTTRDLPLGTELAAGDLATRRATEVPEGALTDPATVVGRRLGSAVRRGEMLTDARLVDRTGTDAGPGRTAVTVRAADGAVSQLVQPGLAVDVLAVDSAGAVTRVATGATVLAVLTDDLAPGDPPPIVLSVAAGEADAVSAASLVGQIALQFV